MVGIKEDWTDSNSNAPLTAGSHPAIRFQQVPIVPGPLFEFEKKRSPILDVVAQKTQEDLQNHSLDTVLEESLYSEQLRLKRSQSLRFSVRKRNKNDRILWQEVQQSLLKPAAEVDRPLLLKKIIHHYGEEIGGHFNPQVYYFSSHLVPWGFSWLLNAASVQRFLPWGMTESLQSRLHILGEVPALQKLATQGTVLLVPTHQSNIDSVLIGYIIYLMSLPPFAYGAGLNLYTNPILRFFMSRLGAYTVDREKKNIIYKQVLKNYSSQILQEGIHSIFFPGGGRSRSGAIESKLKLGLLGTALDAQLATLQTHQTKNKIFIVPMVISYHFVLEARSLIEDYLIESGRHRFMMLDDESRHPTQVMGFFWKLFSSQSAITIRIGKALDCFGNTVDEEGNSIGPNGTFIDPARWLTTRGQLQKEPQRDREYVKELGIRLVDRFHKENTVLTSHLVAFAYFESLRYHYPEFDLFRFLRISIHQRSMHASEFLKCAEVFHKKVTELAAKGEFFLAPELQTSQTQTWVMDGIQQLGLLHDVAVVKWENDIIWTEDMNLLYYYRNRLAGYGLSYRAQLGERHFQIRHYDSQGFLA